MKATTASLPSLLLCYSLLDTNGNNSLKYLEFYFGPKPFNSELKAMTVPQHRLVVKEPTDGGEGGAEEGGGGREGNRTPAPKRQAVRSARGAHLLPALALSGEESWQQEDRMPHCLKARRSSSPSPEPSLQAQTKPLRPIGPNIRPPCNAAEGRGGS